MRYLKVQSTEMSSVAWDEAAELLSVQRHNGKVWRFSNFTSEMWEIFLSEATSKGEYLHNVLLKHGYEEVE